MKEAKCSGRLNNEGERIMERWADGGDTGECAMPGRGDVGCPQVSTMDIDNLTQHLNRAVPTREDIMQPMSKEDKRKQVWGSRDSEHRPPHTLQKFQLSNS